VFEFVDYEIRHHDLDIVIDEEHASFYENFNGDHYIDYDSRTLGNQLNSPETMKKDDKPEEKP
jgi:hypothetical protein